IQGSNRAGRWSPREIRLRMKALPAFYQTTAFRAAVAAIGLALAYGAYRLRVHRLQTRSRELERVVGERTLALAERGRELEAAYVRIEEASLTDPLTQLRNRRYLEQVIGGDLDLCLRRHEDGEAAAGQADLVF